MKPAMKFGFIVIAVASAVILYFVLKQPPNVGEVSDATGLLGGW